MLRMSGENLVSKTYKCDNCTKIYKSPHGLWYHKKKCEKKDIQQIEDITNIKLDISDKALIITLLQQNNNLKQQIIELINKISINNNTEVNENAL